jgi:hypothetical protein
VVLCTLALCWFAALFATNLMVLCTLAFVLVCGAFCYNLTVRCTFVNVSPSRNGAEHHKICRNSNAIPLSQGAAHRRFVDIATAMILLSLNELYALVLSSIHPF